MTQCPACGATNPPSAGWCGQCFTKFDDAQAPPKPTATPGTVAPALVEADAPADGGDVADDHDEITPSVSAGFRRRNGELEWECVTCGDYNELGTDTCLRCGTSFSARWAEPPPPPPSDAEYQRAVMLSAAVAGAGHIVLGRRTSGLTRAVLYVMWLLGGLVLLTAGGPVLLTAGPLLLGALAVWTLTMGDLSRLRKGEGEVFVGKLVVWLVAGVIGLELVGLLTASFAAGR